jgi:general secretion pathway protein C
MGLDSKLKRFFPLVVCALLALTAYFQASGIGQLVASSVSQAPVSAPAPARGTLASTSNKKSGMSILARNPFDSITGPLDGRIAALPPPQESSPSPDGEPTDEDPSCSFGRVLLISASDDPEWSFASIEEGGQRKLRRAGDEVGGHTIQAMAWDRVWLAQGTKRCQMRLGDKSKVATKTGGKKPARKPRKKKSNSRQLPAAMVAKITKVSDTQYNVERSLVDELLQNQAQLMRSARIVPEKEGGDVVGIRLMRIREGTLLSHLGMQNGDRLDSINGFKMGDPQKALEAYGRLRTADKLSVQINRKGTPTTLEFNIQ